MMRGMINIVKDRMTCLYAVNSRPPHGGVALEVSHTQLVWRDDGGADWDCHVEQSGEYLVYLCLSAADDNWMCAISCGPETQSDRINRTTGYFSQSESFYANFQRRSFGSLNLNQGVNRISLNAVKLQDKPAPLRICAINVVPADARKKIEQENQRAMAARTDAQWLGQSGYGVMLHWTAQSKPRHGPPMSYHDAVAALDVDKLAARIHETGASYLLFTFNHAYPTSPAPLKYWEEVHSGWTTERDLIQDLINALEPYGISLLLYLNSPRMGRMNERDRDLIDLDTATPEAMHRYLATHNRLLEEIGLRYGDGVKGYWFDSWYQAFERFGDVPMESVYRAAKAGYDERLATFNFWVLPVDTHWQDYWAGEVCELGNIPPSGVMEAMTFASLPYHALLILDDPWVHEHIETEVKDPQFSVEDLAGFIRNSRASGGAVTINMGVYQNGELGENSMAFMRKVKQWISM